MIDLTKNPQQLEHCVQRAREKNIIIPTMQQLADPELIPESIKKELRSIGINDVDPRNLFRIGWKNEPVEKGGFGKVNYIVLPEELTGVPAKIVALCGKFFPTGCHKVGASFGCLVPRLVTGQFDPTSTRAVWPSTGNFCRGGVYNSVLLGCESIALLPERMSQERFDWLAAMDAEVIATPGCESNVKIILDTAREMAQTRDDVMIFNQFAELGNHLWHYTVTGPAIAEAVAEAGGHLAVCCFSSGSSGVLGAGDYLKERFPNCCLAVGEAMQCPTLLRNGYGDHGIEGIGDKLVPWIHNVRSTDMIVAIDERDPLQLLRLFNEPAGREYLSEELGISPQLIEKLPLLGISGIANILTAIKTAKYYELGSNDVIATVLTDSAAMYGSRLAEFNEAQGVYSSAQAALDYHVHLCGTRTDNMLELTYPERKRIHNLKYYTWVEQQGKSLDELNAQWYDADNYWGGIHAQTSEIDRLITEFNQATGLLSSQRTEASDIMISEVDNYDG